MSKKRSWHKEYKPFIYNHFGRKCTNCQKNIKAISYCVAHHTSYKNIEDKSVYSFDAKHLIDLGIIVLLCNKCHKDLHENESVDNSRILNKCHFCQKEYGDLDRAKTINLDVHICKKCFQGYKSRKVIESNGQLNLFNS